MCRKQLLILKDNSGTSLAVQWLRLFASTARVVGLIPGQRTKTHMPHGVVKEKKKKNSESEILNLRQPPSFPASLMKITFIDQLQWTLC